MSKKDSLSEVTFSRYSLALYELADESNLVKDIENQALLFLPNNPIMEPEFGQWQVIILFLYFISTKNLLYLLTKVPCNNLPLNFI